MPRALVEMGSDIKLISRKIVPRNVQMKKCSLQIRTADNKIITTLGEVVMKCFIENKYFVIYFIVVESIPRFHPRLEFLSKNVLKIYFAGKGIRIKWNQAKVKIIRGNK